MGEITQEFPTLQLALGEGEFVDEGASDRALEQVGEVDRNREPAGRASLAQTVGTRQRASALQIRGDAIAFLRWAEVLETREPAPFAVCVAVGLAPVDEAAAFSWR